MAQVKSAEAPLDTLTELRKTIRYKRLRNIQRVTGMSRISRCHKAIKYGHDSVDIVARSYAGGDQSVSVLNVIRCGSVWACSVCSHVQAMAERSAISQAVTNAQAIGWTVWFLTTTIAHDHDTSLADEMQQVADARRSWRNRAAWKSAAKEAGYRGSIRVLEITLGENGWHLHVHELLFCEKRTDMWKTDGGMRAWSKACLDAGVKPISEDAQFCRQVRPGHDANYMTKWSISDELTDPQQQKLSPNYTVWELADRAAAGDQYCLFKWHEYEEATFGRKRVYWSADLKTLLTIEEQPKEDEIVSEEQIISISRNTWYRMTICGAHLDLLERLEELPRELQRQYAKSFVRQFIFDDWIEYDAGV